MSLLLFFYRSIAAALATVVTNAVTDLQLTQVRANGTISADGYTPILERGFVLSTSSNPTLSDTQIIVPGTTGSYTALFANLLSNTTYHVRAYATNAVGTSYGADVSFTTYSMLLQTPKQYLYRVFSAGVYKGTWTKEVLSEPTFKTTINGGVGELKVSLGRKFDDFGEGVDVALNNKVELWCVDQESINGTLLYAGYISGYEPVIDGVKETIEVTVLGYIAELQRMILRDTSGNTTLAYNSYDPSAILKDVIDKYRALGGTINYSASSVALTNTVVSYTFNANTIKECLDKIIQLCPVGWYWRVAPDNTIYLQPTDLTTANHNLFLGLQIEKLKTFRRIENIVNRVLFVGGGDPALFRKYENTSSQDAYGLYEVKIVDQRVTVVATAATISTTEIDTKSSPEIQSTLEVVDSNGPGNFGYDIESVAVGQSIQIGNINVGQKTITLWDQAMWDVDVWDETLATTAASIIQILAVTYHPDSIIIEASSRLPQIAKRIEDVERNLLVTQMVNNPSSPS